MKWMKLFLRQFLRKKKNRLGYAILKKDDISGKKRWITWNTKGEDKIAFDLGAPLVFPTDKLPVGTYIEMYKKKGQKEK